MTPRATVILWGPRLAGIALALFLSLFALDAFAGKPFAAGFPEFLVHLAPALLVAAIVAVAWWYPLAGATGFALLALAYTLMVRGRLDWVAAIAGPLAIVAALFFLSWRVKS